MNRGNKLLLGVLAFVVVCVVGYALFSETITVTGTATAKGDFEITISEADITNPGVQWMYGAESFSSGLVKNPTILIRDNVVTTNVIFGMPGSRHAFGIRIENTGTIPVKLKSIKDLTRNVVIIDKDNDNNNYAEYSVINGTNEVVAILFNETGYVDDYEYGVDDMMRDNDYFSNPDAMLSAVLDPGEFMYFFFEYAWVVTSTIPGDDLTLSWDVQFNFEQVTTN